MPLLTSPWLGAFCQFPDYDDEANVVTKVVRRKFAFAREVGEYDELIEGEGQEPLNSVYYKDWDDRMHLPPALTCESQHAEGQPPPAACR